MNQHMNREELKKMTHNRRTKKAQMPQLTHRSWLVPGLILTAMILISCNGDDQQHGKTSKMNHSAQSITTGDTLMLDTQASSLGWWASKVTGAHSGSVAIAGGYTVIQNGKLTGGEVVVQMNTLTNEDIESAEWNAKLVNHLKNADFFNVEQFPTAVLTLTQVTPIEPGQYQATGDLTIKGITHSVTFPLTVEQQSGIWHGTGETTLDRTLWDIRYHSGKFFQDLGDKVIYDDFKLNFNLKTQTKTAV